MYSAVSAGTSLTSFVAFWLFNKLLDDKSTPVKVPERYSGYTKCKWRNVMGSVVHAVIVSVIGVYICFYRTPQYLTERVTTHTTLGEVNICITVGYLMYDAIDLIRFQGVHSTWPILIHHFVLNFLGFGCVMYSQQLVAYALFGSLIEFNSIFLHGRQLLLMYGYSKTSLAYRINNAINIFTYIALRFVGGCFVLFAWLPEDYKKMTLFWFCAFCVTAVTIILISAVLFYRLLKSDFFSKGTFKGESIMLGNGNAELKNSRNN